jgi:hypothetical protein
VGFSLLRDFVMTKLERWIGRVEVLTPATDRGDTKAFTNVITWARNPDEFRTTVAGVFDEYGWSLLGVEDCHPVASRTGYDAEFLEGIERARGNLNACIYPTFHYYPSQAY